MTPHMQRVVLTAPELASFEHLPGQDVMLLVDVVKAGRSAAGTPFARSTGAAGCSLSTWSGTPTARGSAGSGRPRPA